MGKGCLSGSADLLSHISKSSPDYLFLTQHSYLIPAHGQPCHCTFQQPLRTWSLTESEHSGDGNILISTDQRCEITMPLPQSVGAWRMAKLSKTKKKKKKKKKSTQR